MGYEVIIPIVISVLTVLWTVYRDKSSDVKAMDDRIGQLETQAQLRELEIKSLKSELALITQQQRDFNLSINDINKNLVRILTILDLKDKEGS